MLSQDLTPYKTYLKTAPLASLLILIIAYFLSPLFQYQLGPGGFNDQRFIQLLFGVICLLTVIINRHYRQAFLLFLGRLPLVPALCLVLFFVAVIIGSLIAPYTLRALQEVGLYAIILIAICALIHEFGQLGQEQLRRLLIIAFGTFLVVYALYFVIYYASIYVAKSENFINTNRWMPNFYNPRSFNQVEVWLLPAFFWLCHHMGNRSQTLNFISYGLTALWWAMLFYTMGRGIFLAMVVSTLSITLLFRKQALFLLKPALITMILGIGLYTLMFVAPPTWLQQGESQITFLDRIQDTYSEDRFELWELAWQTFLENPIFGGGAQHYSYYHGKFGHPHNMVASYLAELGLLGTLPLAVLAIVGSWGLIKSTLKGYAEINFMFVYGLIAVAVYSLFTAQLYFPASQLLLILFLALALDQNLNKVVTQDNTPHLLATPYITRSTFAVICSLAVICLLVSVQDLVTNPPVIYQVKNINYPRFWLNGDFRRYPNRQLLPRVLNCKVNEYAPAFACR